MNGDVPSIQEKLRPMSPPCLVFGAKFSDTNGTPLNPIRWAYRRGIVVTPIKNYNFIVNLAGGDLELSHSHRDYNFS